MGIKVDGTGESVVDGVVGGGVWTSVTLGFCNSLFKISLTSVLMEASNTLVEEQSQSCLF